MNRTIAIGVLAVFTLGIGVAFPVNAQRIGIEDTASDTRSNDTETQQETDPETSASSNRIIPPEEFGKYRNQKSQQSQLSKDALIEKLQADSASMRIRFRETMRELKADSQAMRKTIRKLRRKRRELSRKLGRITASEGSGDTSEQLREADTSPTPDVRSDETSGSTTSSKPDTDVASETSDREEESSGSTANLNPNTASLSDLKSISGLSDRLAERIEWYRREVRPFGDLQDLRRVPGIDRGTFDRIKEHFREGPY